MHEWVLGFDELDRAQVPVVGAKGAQLGELSRIPGVNVPPGFCVTTDAFHRAVAAAPAFETQLDRLARLGPEDLDAIRTQCAELRRTVEAAPIPSDLATAITRAVARIGDHAAFAVRSSATAEDLPTTSFAGQHDTYLGVVGPVAVLEHVSRCWASLFTERAVAYRLRNGFDHRRLAMGVVVQQQVDPRCSGVLFTADPVTSNRKVVVVEAVAGLGESLVSGRVDPDVYTVRDDRVVDHRIATVGPDVHQGRTLTDEQAVALARLGRRIEEHFGQPQDVEWCLDDDGFQFVQSRPITTLFPVPDLGDQRNHVFVSVGHAQMMTDAMKPLGISFWQLTTPRPMHVAGGRLFVDVAPDLESPTRRAALLELFGRSDPLVGGALATILERDEFVPPRADEGTGAQSPVARAAGEPAGAVATDPAVVTALMERSQASIARLKQEIRGRSGTSLLDFVRADLGELRRILFDPESHQVFMSAMDAANWLNEHLEAWLGEKNAADVLTQSVPHNITSEMGLALLDVADVIRPYPQVVALLERVGGEDFLDELPALEGGREARDAIAEWLDTYGMRCVGEIDITRPRWAEQPSALVPVILGNVRNFEPGAAARRFEQGREAAQTKAQEVLARLRQLPDGERKAEETARRIDRVRTFIGYREYPKYGMISRYFVYKQALLDEADRLVRADVLDDRSDIFYLTFDELHDVVRTQHADRGLIERRKVEFRSFQTLTPPRVFTSEGEVVAAAYAHVAAPAGALLGLPVSSGTVEGRARVIVDMAQADLDPGDILVTPYTDPSWTPLFVSAAGLVTEVGGLMTHGAVIAREYGLPAVVGVQGATRLIPDGARIRLNGTDGWVELLPAAGR